VSVCVRLRSVSRSVCTVTGAAAKTAFAAILTLVLEAARSDASAADVS
jgi:hypothetical protein